MEGKDGKFTHYYKIIDSKYMGYDFKYVYDPDYAMVSPSGERGYLSYGVGVRRID